MGQQQLLLIILGVIIVGIAIAVGLQLFQAGSVGANQDAIVNDIMNIAAHADQYRIRPSTMGGGDGEFVGYTLPQRLAETGNATYDEPEPAVTAETVTIVGVSKLHDGRITLVYRPNPDPETDDEQYDWSATGVFEGAFGD